MKTSSIGPKIAGRNALDLARGGSAGDPVDGGFPFDLGVGQVGLYLRLEEFYCTIARRLSSRIGQHRDIPDNKAVGSRN